MNAYENEEDGERTWEDLFKYGYIGASGGPKYTKPLLKLKPDDPIFAYQKKAGYMGYGQVIGTPSPIKDFILASDGQPLLSHPLKAPNAAQNVDDPNRSEWCVPVRWIKIFPREQAKFFKGAFANQAIVCKLRDPATVQFLEKEFGVK